MKQQTKGNQDMQNHNVSYLRIVPALLIALAMGCIGLAPAAQAARRPSIVGLWDVQYYQSTGDFLFQTYDQWHSDGLEFEVNSIAPGAVCQGTFKTAANGIVHLHHLVFTYDTNGVVNGHIDETQLNTVSDDGNSYSGTFDQKFYDLDGNFLFELTGTQTAIRITLER
jgi:hypothetical protein